MAWINRLVARGIRASTIVDAAARRFDQARSTLVTRFAPGSVLDAYNDLVYGQASVYRAGSGEFREALFNWEIEAMERALPGPSGRVLVGGAGGGREAFAVAARGHEVIAFEPSPVLARSMVEHAPAGVRVEVFVGRYEDLPWLTRGATGERVDLRSQAPYDAAIFGWVSYSHLRTRPARVAALGAVAALTNGAIVVSVYTRRPRATSRGVVARLARVLGLEFTGDLFTPFVGFYHLSTRDELEAEAREAGLRIVHASFDELDGRWPYVILERA